MITTDNCQKGPIILRLYQSHTPGGLSAAVEQPAEPMPPKHKLIDIDCNVNYNKFEKCPIKLLVI